MSVCQVLTELESPIRIFIFINPAVKPINVLAWAPGVFQRKLKCEQVPFVRVISQQTWWIILRAKVIWASWMWKNVKIVAKFYWAILTSTKAAFSPVKQELKMMKLYGGLVRAKKYHIHVSRYEKPRTCGSPQYACPPTHFAKLCLLELI